MLSYQHIYHAGCIADVHKHSILSVILGSLPLKNPDSFDYFETHAGRGLYDLTAPEAQKTGEYKLGIEKIIKNGVFPKSHIYLQNIEKCHADHGTSTYPGSPMIANYLLRRKDQIHLMELHPQEIKFLKKNLHQPNIKIHFQDGYNGVLNLPSPPDTSRALILIDPSYEIKQEYTTAVDFVKKMHHKWPEALIILWYPMLKMHYHDQIQNTLPDFIKNENLYINELQFADEKTTKGMYGSGLAIINCPHEFFPKIEECKNLLSQSFQN
ncbi:MAG: 23S rRNA (adenine(2030)-N(6))-methyltransferase RlmJ [Verrucomicrobia bacterium]|nr:MAG: 23S rRNA (adenine(2030)-N(6))-methyltransferase RlmJ [Verrucomicrobiota bacterium]